MTLRLIRPLPPLADPAAARESPGDPALIARVLSGDKAAYRALFLRHAPAVRRLLGSLFRDEHEADEATQETFVRAHAALTSLRDPARLRPWLLGIARIVWLDAGEKQQRLERLHAALGEPAEAPHHHDPEHRALSGEADLQLSAALGRLSPERRTALLLRLDQGLGYGEIALAMAWPLHKVKNELHRARLEIRGDLLAYLEGTR
jgi:RNA polymerase sigma-70 factor (ECF subfamily)